MGKFVGCPIPVWKDPKIVKLSREGKIEMTQNKNPRKGKVMYGLWLTKEEEKGLLEILGDEIYLRYLGKLILKLFIRGDFKKR